MGFTKYYNTGENFGLPSDGSVDRPNYGSSIVN